VPAELSFVVFLINRGGEKEALLESCLAFEVAKARMSGLVNLVSLKLVSRVRESVY